MPVKYAEEATGNTEYWDAYCVKKWQNPFRHAYFPPVVADETKQPVGGRVQHRYWLRHVQQVQQQCAAARALRSTSLPAMARATFPPPTYSAGGTNKAINKQDQRQCHCHCHQSGKPMCHKADKSSSDSISKPLAVPDVHKLRYMHGKYISCDDWY